MNVASLSNCKKLYKLSGWEDTPLCWANRPNHRPAWIIGDWSDARYAEMKKLVPAYDSGYLLRKLPNKVYEPKRPHATLMMICPDYKTYYFGYTTRTGEDFPFDQRALFFARQKSPEDALALLTIKLWEEGLLK